MARRNRIIKYSRGIRARLAEVEAKYFLEEVDIADGDLVIDVGANIGEVSMALLNRGFNIRIMAVEPDPLEFECLRMNLGSHATYLNTFLFSENISMPAIYENRSGDTRLIPEYDETPDLFIEAHTLDSRIQGLGIEEIKLLKIEVEGSEPEVLQGAVTALKITKFVAVDTSLERGIDLLSTFEDVNKILTETGFCLVKQYRNDSALYKRLE